MATTTQSQSGRGITHEGNGNLAGPPQTSAPASSQPHLGQKGAEIQKYGTLALYPLGLSHDARLAVTGALNQLLADTMVLRDMYKKHHWQLSGPTFYSLHRLFDKHHEEQAKLVDAMAERVQTLGGVAIAMAHDIAEVTRIERPPRGREALPVQLSRMLDAHQVILEDARRWARKSSELGDEGSNDLLVSQVVRINEMQVWFISEHLVQMPLVEVGRD